VTNPLETPHDHHPLAAYAAIAFRPPLHL